MSWPCHTTPTKLSWWPSRLCAENSVGTCYFQPSRARYFRHRVAFPLGPSGLDLDLDPRPSRPVTLVARREKRSWATDETSHLLGSRTPPKNLEMGWVGRPFAVSRENPFPRRFCPVALVLGFLPTILHHTTALWPAQYLRCPIQIMLCS